MLRCALRSVGLPFSVRRCATSPVAQPGFPGMHLVKKKIGIPLPIALFGGWTTLQYYLGHSDDFFLGKFHTTKDPDALAEFYQAEDLLRIIAVHPIFFNLFMDKVEPDATEPTDETALLSTDETKFNVKLFGMEVSFEIIQQEDDDGLTSFMRHERFIDWVPYFADLGFKQLLWDQTWTYGFKRLEDGSYEVYHHGEKFRGPWPIRLVIFFHQYYVLWACEKHINGEAFGTEDLDAQQEELACIPLHVFKKFVGKVHDEKARQLEELKNSAMQDSAAIAKAQELLDNLQKLGQSDHSTISMAKQSVAKPGNVAGQSTAKMVAEDVATQEVLMAALKNKDGDKDRAVDAALSEVMKNEDLKFEKRPLKRTGSSYLRNSSDAESLRLPYWARGTATA